MTIKPNGGPTIISLSYLERYFGARTEFFII